MMVLVFDLENGVMVTKTLSTLGLTTRCIHATGSRDKASDFEIGVRPSESPKPNQLFGIFTVMCPCKSG